MYKLTGSASVVWLMVGSNSCLLFIIGIANEIIVSGLVMTSERMEVCVAYASFGSPRVDLRRISAPVLYASCITTGHTHI